MLTYNTTAENALKLAHPCRCNVCENSCNYGSGVLADGDLGKLAGFLGISEKETTEKYLEEIEKFNTKRLRPRLLREKDNPYGKCIFYEKDVGCKVHSVKPLECSIAMGCKPYGEELIIWFDERHFLNTKDLESLRQYKAYIESGGKILPGAELETLADKDTLEKMEKFTDRIDTTDWEERLGIKDILKEERAKEERRVKKNGKK
jgi:Fe-S-cluster containining protein